jgi:(p)ppGpp synthase/HD superfamily hydrolase
MNDLRSYERAIRFAVNAHKRVFDKAGMPYILHPLRVAEALDTEEERIVAVLHDVVEDDPNTSIGDIYKAFGDVVGDAVDCMTKLEKVGGKFESYREYLDRVRANPIALRVKLADMTDNSRPDRLASLSVEKQLRLVAKYTRGRHYLLTGMWYVSDDLDRIIKAGAKK